MVKILPRDPVFGFDALRRNTAEKVFPLSQEDILFCGYARAALYEGLKIMAVAAGKNILLPDYICNVALSPLHFLGIRPKFYSLRKDLTPDWESVNKQADSETKALLLVNYFGFPNDHAAARDFCADKGIYFIEDNAHGFLSSDGDTFLGSRGDISIFSFRKTVAIPEGAALLINNKRLKERAVEKKLPLTAKNRPLRFIAKSILRSLKYRHGIGFNRIRQDGKKQVLKGGQDEEFGLERYLVGVSPLSTFLLKRLDHQRLIETRRNAFSEWLKFFSRDRQYKATPVFTVLKDGVAPFVFPVLAENPEVFIREMREQSVESFTWPYLPRDSREKYFSGKLVCLPVSAEFSSENFLKNG